jgi:antitoxin component YwqK of YwqJK toxin-antitoxin module
VEYSDTGKVLAKGEFLDGLEEGEWYYYVGDHREEGNYEGGYQTGVWKHYYDNDKLRFEGTYIDGEPDGKHTYYHRNGNKMIQGSYIMGKKEGEWKRFNEYNEVIFVIEYEDGNEVRVDGIKIKVEERE